jgi:outer membrane protein assembly factor BamB
MRRIRTFLGFVVLLGVLGPGSVSPVVMAASDPLPLLADVPMFRGDSRRSAVHPGPGPISEPQLAWTNELDSDVATFPVLVGGLLIVGTAGGDLVALDARTGEERWRAAGGGRFNCALASDAGIVVAADATSILAFDAATGAERWQRDVASDGPRIEITDGVVYVGTIDGAVKGLDLQTGADRWSWQGDHGLSVRVDIVADGVVYANPSDGRMVAINLSDGSERWSFQSPASLLGIHMTDDTVFTGGLGFDSATIDAATGRVRWQLDLPGDAGVITHKDGVLYAGSRDGGLWALVDHGTSYEILWHNETRFGFTPTLAGGALYGVSPDGRSLSAVGTDDGALLWEVPTNESGPVMGPVVSGGMAFTVDQEGGGTVAAYAEPDLIARLPEPFVAQPTLPAVSGLPDPFRVVRATPLSETGVVLSPFDPPRSEGPEGVSMTVGPDGLLYVIDPASVVTVIDPATSGVVRRFGRQGAGEGEFACICQAIDAGPDGLLYVVDGANHRVQVLAPDGTFVRQLGGFGSEEGQFVFPFALTIDGTGAVYILDGDNNMISKFGPDGAFLWRVGGRSGDAALRTPTHGLAVLQDGTILVTFDPVGLPAVLLDPDDGSVIGPWGEESLGGAGEPTVDPDGNVYLFQYVPWAVRMFDPSGQPLGMLDYEDDVPDPYRFFPAPVFAPDGYGYSFDDTQGLLRLEITLP